MADQRDKLWVEPDGSTSDPDWMDSQNRLRHHVQLQSQQIEQVLSRHNVPAELHGGSVRAHWVSFDLVTQLNNGWQRVRRLTGELATALGVPEVRLDRQGGRLRLAVRRYEPHPVDLLDLHEWLPEAGDLYLPLGLDDQGRPVMLNLAQADLLNVLVAGVSGAGKSSLLRSIAVSLALSCRQSQAQLAVIGLGSAPSGITTRPNPLYPVSYLPHLLFPVAATPDEAVEALDYLVQEVAYRAENGITSPLLVVLIDDADMLLRRLGKPAADYLAQLMHAPSAAALRVIVSAANPGLPDLHPILRHNVDLRLVGRMADERAARAATGIDDSYAHYLDGKGDFLSLSAGGMSPFQAAYIDDYDLHLILTELHRASAPALLAQAMDPRPGLPPSWSAADPQSFTYDPVNYRINLEPDDRSGFDTIEILVESDDDRPVPDGGAPRLWPHDHHDPTAHQAPNDATQDLDHGRLDGPVSGAAGYAGPLEETSGSDDMSESARKAGPPLAAGSRPLSGPGQAPLATGLDFPPEKAAEDKSSAQDSAERPGRYRAAGAFPAASYSDAHASDHEPEAGYQMLPFDDLGSTPDDTAAPAAGNAGEDAQLNGATAPASHAASGRAQVLWPVEPVYTDIDDDLWDGASPDEDDWRHRLH